MDRPTCETCPWFEAWERSSGECRRHAPQPRVLLENTDEEHVIPRWPELCSEDWCGEHPLAAEWARVWLEKRKEPQP